ncbi:MAG: hypothetical protein Q8M11_07515 [Sulfuritalea sp.]|nr:hypothetical protein [Sulfuritalea sp.]MDP1984841.1 hypothetical protein [Sulfuritalea sp.]
MIEQLLLALGANALIVGALAFLIRSLVGHRLEKDIAEFKRDIERTAQREIETYRAQLEKDRLRLQISYGGIFEKQANAILDIYRSVVALERAASDAVHSGGNLSERQAGFHQSWAAVRNSFLDNRILLPRETDEMLSKFIDRMSRSVFEVTRIEKRDLSRVTDDEFRRLTDRQEKAYEIIESELPELRERLIKSMRLTVGVVASDL